MCAAILCHNALNRLQLIVQNWAKKPMEPREIYINRIANFLNIRSALPRFSNVGLNGRNVIFQRLVNTHWHVGEKIAVAEKEA